MMNIDFNAGGLVFKETKGCKVFFCAILETENSKVSVKVRHFLANDTEDAKELLETQAIEDTENGYYKKFSDPQPLKSVLAQLNMEVIDEDSLDMLDED